MDIKIGDKALDVCLFNASERDGVVNAISFFLSKSPSKLVSSIAYGT